MSAVTHTFRFSGAGEDFGPRSDGIVTFHTWESDPVKTTVADAMKGLVWQDGDDVAGSYNRVVCSDGVISAVPDDHASGGINPGSSFWNPKTWLYEQLDADEIANPNYFTLNVCAMGQRAYYDTHGWPASIIDGMARSWIDEEQRLGRKVVPTNHADFQTNRSDAGAIAMALIKQRYQELTEDALPELTTYALEIIQIDAEANIRSGPSPDAPVLFQTVRESSAVRVGTVGDFSVYWLASKAQWAYTDKVNVLSAKPYEVIKEVPTGITPAQLQEATDKLATATQTIAALKAKIATAARALG